MQCNCLAYDIYSSWSGGDQTRPHSSAETKIWNEQRTTATKYRRGTGPLCSCTCIAALLLAERQQHKGTAAFCFRTSVTTVRLLQHQHRCPHLLRTQYCWPSTTACGAACDSAPGHQQPSFTCLQRCPESIIGSRAKDLMPTTSSPPMPMVLLGTWC